MLSRYILRKRRNRIIYSDAVLVALLCSGGSLFYLKTSNTIALLIGIATAAIFVYFFFLNKLIRYSLSIFFSLLWAGVVFLAGQIIQSESVTTLSILAIVAFGVSIWAHKDHFTFIKNARIYEYEHY